MSRRVPPARWLPLAAAAACHASFPSLAGAFDQGPDIVLTTTTSVRDAGLLDALLPPFERETGLRVRVIAVGSGQAMELGRRGEADLLILHDPAGERRFIAQGFGVDRQPLMRNTFVVVGPADDPAGIRGTAVREALRVISERGVTFVSRGDRSGTHTRELALWAASDVAARGEWYLETGQGMGATLVVADQLGAYALSDIATFLAHKAPLQLEILVAGDSALVNPYHVMRAAADRFPHINEAGARRLAEYLLSAGTQRMIGSFGVREFGRALFEPARD